MARAPIAPTALVLALVLAFDARAQQAKPDSCVECHEAQDEPRLVAPVKALRAGDVHAAAGFSCVDCHGGDPALGTETGTKADAMDPKKGYVGRPRGLEVARMCGRCHSDIELMRRFNPREPTDQQAQYLTSVHGKRAAAGDERRPQGPGKVGAAQGGDIMGAPAVCASCHGAHGIRRVADPASPVNAMHVVETCTRCHADAGYMKGYPIPTDQLEKYRRSVHGHKRLDEHDPGAPACNTCHGNHGAVPPGAGAVTHVCGKCHAMQAELFAASGHAKAFAAGNIPPCTTCHGTHEIKSPDDSWLRAERPGGAPGVCVACHTPGDKCDRAAAEMYAGIRALAADIATADGRLTEAGEKGMDVERARFDLAGARDALVRTRVMVHAFSRERFQATVSEGGEAAAAVLAAGDAALAEHTYRRRGLAIAAGCLLLFAALLARKARRLEARDA